MSHEVERISSHHLICLAFLSFKEIRRNSYLKKMKAGPKLDLLHCLISSELSISTPLVRFCFKKAFTAYPMGFSFQRKYNVVLFANFKSHILFVVLVKRKEIIYFW